MSSVARTYVFLLLLVSFVIASVEAQRLWCHGGGADREYSPIQCPDETIECFKFVCKNAQTGQGSFVSRGCGVAVPNPATALTNESCFQAQSVCEQLHGRPHCYTCNNVHMCNGMFRTQLPTLFLFTVVVLVLLVY